MIFDDCVSQLHQRSGKPRILSSLYMRGRHSNISVVISSQEYMSVPKNIRINASCVIIFRVANRKELKGISEELGGTMTQSSFEQMCETVWSVPYRFVVVNLASQTLDDKYFASFTQRILIQK